MEAVLAVCLKARLLDQETTVPLVTSTVWLGSECLGSRRLWLPEGTRNLALAAGI